MISAGLSAAPVDVCFRRIFATCCSQTLRSNLSLFCFLQGKPSVHRARAAHCSTCLQSKDSSRGHCQTLSLFNHFGAAWLNGFQVRSVSETVLEHSGKNLSKNDTSSFSEKENEYFHSFLESSSDYSPYLLSSMVCYDTLTELDPETMDKKFNEVKEAKMKPLLQILEHWCAVAAKGQNVPADASFSLTVKLLGKNAQKMPKEQLIEGMAYLSRLGFRESDFYLSEPRKNRILLSKTFDQVCCKKCREFEVKELLLAADFFYAMRGSAFTEFPYLMCERLKHFLPTLTSPELMLVLFHTGLARRSPPGLVDATLNQLEQSITTLSLQELGIVNLAYYKTQSSLRNPAFFKALTHQLKQGAASDLDPIGLSALLKYQQKSLNKKKDSFVPQFFSMMQDMDECLLQRIPKLPSETLMHVLNLYYSLDLLSENLFMAIVQRIIEQGLKDWRVKDIARVTHVIANVSLGEESRMEALAEILAELQKSERLAERVSFYGSMLQVAIAMTACAVYPHWLVQEIFCDVSQQKFKGSDIDWRRDLYHLSESILIEDDTYQGPLLWPENFPKLSKSKVYCRLNGVSVRGMVGKDTISQRDWALLALMDTLREIHPTIKVQPVFLLSHFQTADIEILPKSTKESRERPSPRKQSCGHMEPADTAVVLHSTNAYQNIRCRDGQTVPVLRQYHSMRARQLRQLGVTVVEVSHTDFSKAEDKCQYLKDKFADANALKKLE